jgi:hypothetical protein
MLLSIFLIFKHTFIMKLDLFLAIFILIATPIFTFGMFCYLEPTSMNLYYICMFNVIGFGGSYLLYDNYKTKKKDHERTT